MNKQQQQEFLSRPCESNTQWVAQVLLQLEPKERHTIVHALRKLDKHLYKSWAKDMTLNEIIESVNIFSEAKTAVKDSALHTMKDPGTQQPDELKKESEQENAQESASIDQATEATQDSEEGGIEG